MVDVNRIVTEPFTVTQEIKGSDGASGDYFGAAIAMTDAYMAVGVMLQDGAGSNWGACYVYEKTAGVWAEVIKLVPSSSAKSNVYFGNCVAMGGDVLAVGAVGDGNGTTTAYGAVYVYRRVAGTWTLETTLRRPTGSPASGDNFGRNVDITPDGTRMVVGMPTGVSGKRLPAYVYHDAGGGTWTPHEIYPPDWANDDVIGESVAISADGTTVVVGSSGDDDSGSASGSANVWKWNAGTGAWNHAQKLLASDGAAGDTFGTSVGVSADGSVIAVAAPGCDEPVSGSGAVYVFELSGGTWTESCICTTRVPDMAAHSLGTGYTTSSSTIGMQLMKFASDGSLLLGVLRDPSPASAAGTFRAFVPDADGWSAGYVERCYTAIPNNVASMYFGAMAVASNSLAVGHAGAAGYAAGTGVVYYLDTLPWEAPAPAPDTTPPTFAGVTGATASEGVITLTWDAATDAVTATDAIQYEVHVSTSPGDTWTTRAVVSAADVLPEGWESIEGAIECSFDLDYLAPGSTYYVRVRARDEAGNADANTEEVSAEIELVVDEVAPVIDNISPAPGTPLNPGDRVSFDATDDSGALVHVEVRVTQGAVVETVFDGSAFVGLYATGCGQTAIANGYRFSVVRSGGWIAPPSFSISAIDGGGNKA